MATARTSPASFLYVAATLTGGRKMGVRAAASERALVDALRRDRLMLVRSWRLPGWAGASAEGLTPLRDQAAMNEQLSSLVSRGVPIVEALEVAEAVVSSGTREKIRRMREHVGSGASFAEACERVGGFDVIAIAVYRAAERTGDLGAAAARLAESARRRLKIGGRAVTMTIYPAVVLTISVLASGIMLTVVVPMVGNALEQIGADLPGYTKVIVGTGRWLRDQALWVLMGLAGLTALVVSGRRRVFNAISAFMRRLPAFRALQTTIESARFFSVMGAMTRTGVPVADALGVAASAVSAPKLREQLERLRQRLVDGGVFRSLIDEVDALPVSTRRLLVAAERGGDLDSVFDSLAADLTDEVDRRTDRLMALVEPLLIVFLFLVIGTLLLSIMIPMITISSRVRGAG